MKRVTARHSAVPLFGIPPKSGIPRLPKQINEGGQAESGTFRHLPAVVNSIGRAGAGVPARRSAAFWHAGGEREQCELCPVNRDSKLVKLGIDASAYDYVVALAGNPNVGKSTVFNNLTGLRQHTGNWPGKTVVRAEGAFSYAGKRFKLVDLPGTYSLLSTSTDEEIARDFILFGQPDVTTVVVDATRLERNLNLVLQVLEITERALVCLNLIDEAERHGIRIDERSLTRDLGVPVVPVAARSGRGIANLLQSIAEVASGEFVYRPKRTWTRSKKLKRAVDTLVAKLHAEFPGLPNARWTALRLLEGDQSIIDAVRSGELSTVGNGSRAAERTRVRKEEKREQAFAS